MIIVAIAGSPSEETVPWLSSGFRWVYCIGIVSILETVVAVPALLSYIGMVYVSQRIDFIYMRSDSEDG